MDAEGPNHQLSSILSKKAKNLKLQLGFQISYLYPFHQLSTHNLRFPIYPSKPIFGNHWFGLTRPGIICHIFGGGFTLTR